MIPPQALPHRAEVEHLVRRALYQQLGRKPPRLALAPNPLVVNVSARHGHLTPAAVEALFGKGDPAALDASTLRDATAELPGGEVAPGDSVVDALVATGLVDSRNAARRVIGDGLRPTHSLTCWTSRCRRGGGTWSGPQGTWRPA